VLLEGQVVYERSKDQRLKYLLETKAADANASGNGNGSK
jgi:hypothetical protein